MDMRKWQYQTNARLIGAHYAEVLSEWLDRMGSHGWELCAVSRDGIYDWYHFKRELVTPIKSVPLWKMADGTWLALEHLSIESIKISGVTVDLDVPLSFKPGQRLVIERHSTSNRPVTISFEETP